MLLIFIFENKFRLCYNLNRNMRVFRGDFYGKNSFFRH